MFLIFVNLLLLIFRVPFVVVYLQDAEDEPLEEDELPEWKRPQPKIDLSQLNPNDPEGMLKMSKQGRTLMMFASVSGSHDALYLYISGI